MLKWKHHYTGLDIGEAKVLGVSIYVSIDGPTKRMYRLSIPYHMVGLFTGRGNYVKGNGGWELFTRNHHIGWSKEYGKRKFFRVHWSGSMKEPWSSVTWRVGRFGIGGRTPKWLKRAKERREMEHWITEGGPEE